MRKKKKGLLLADGFDWVESKGRGRRVGQVEWRKPN
jgi:hypothetical protein